MKRRNFLKILSGMAVSIVVTPAVARLSSIKESFERPVIEAVQRSSSYGDISQITAKALAKEMLENARPILTLKEYGISRELPLVGGNTVKFRRPISYSPSIDIFMDVNRNKLSKIKFDIKEITRREIMETKLDFAAKGNRIN